MSLYLCKKNKTSLYNSYICYYICGILKLGEYADKL